MVIGDHTRTPALGAGCTEVIFRGLDAVGHYAVHIVGIAFELSERSAAFVEDPTFVYVFVVGCFAVNNVEGVAQTYIDVRGASRMSPQCIGGLGIYHVGGSYIGGCGPAHVHSRRGVFGRTSLDAENTLAQGDTAAQYQCKQCNSSLHIFMFGLIK